MNRPRPPWVDPPPGNDWCSDCIEEGGLCRSCEEERTEAALEDAYESRMEMLREDREARDE
jgi:hypothetical protein